LDLRLGSEERTDSNRWNEDSLCRRRALGRELLASAMWAAQSAVRLPPCDGDLSFGQPLASGLLRILGEFPDDREDDHDGDDPTKNGASRRAAGGRLCKQCEHL